MVYAISFSVTDPSEGGVSVQGTRNFDGEYDIISILSEDASDLGAYDIAQWINEYVNFDSNPNCVYDLDTSFNHFIEITRLDYQEQVVSGKFQMRVINENCDTLTITEGRFDLAP